MIFQCKDLERALEFPELMPDARAHAEKCENCRRELYLWSEISRVAPQLHQEWDSPELWPRIQDALAAEPQRRKPIVIWRWAAAAAAMALLAIAVGQPWKTRPATGAAFLTDEALTEVQQAEAAYARSIEHLSAVARPELEKSPAPLAAAYREKLLALDSAIADVKANLENNRYNTYLQSELASLYKEKQNTLKEWLDYAKRN
ncbi:MAG TPA: hypothetical protein VGF59_23855 [Bryobacteraceae bacterium]|jgi:negative regulator of sigma E activity